MINFAAIQVMASAGCPVKRFGGNFFWPGTAVSYATACPLK